MRRMLCLMLPFFIFVLSGCSGIIQPKSISKAQTRYQSYREIPNVTQSEINALENLLKTKPRLVYGVGVTTEAFLRSDGSVGGFVELFCNRLTELFGFEFDIFHFDWDELNEKIVSKEIDLVGDFTATPERLQKFLMTDTIIQRTVKVFTNINDDSLNVISKTRPIRCAFMEGSTTYSLVKNTWNFPFEPVFVDGQSVVPDMFLNGEIDAFIEEGVLEAVFDSYDFIKSEVYYPLSYSPVSLTTANPELEPIISVIQKYLKNGGNYELTELYNQGYKDYLGHKLFGQLTEEEKEYILQHNNAETAVIVACETDKYPSSFYNEQEKEFQGIAVEILDEIAYLTGLVFQIGNQPTAMWPELLEGLENGKYSIVSELMYTNQRKGRFLWADTACYTDKYAMLSKVDYPDVDINQVLFSKVGLVKDAAYTDVFLEWFPDSVDTVMYYGNEKALAALEKGEIDLLMATENLLLHLTNYLEKPNFKANIVFDFSTASFLGFNKDEQILHSIVNKALKSTNTEEIAARWQRKIFDYNSKMLRDMIPYAAIFTVLLLAALFVVCFLFIKNKTINRNLEKLVTERTNELERQTATLSTIYNSIPDLVFCKDMNSIYTSCNPSLEKLMGMTEAEIIGKSDIEIFKIDKEMAKVFVEADQKVLSGRDVVKIEEIVTYPDGTQRVMETVKTPLIQNGEVIGMMGISRDISQRKATEETLKLTLDNLDASVYITEIETGEILFVNRKMSEEYDDSDCVGKKCWEVLQKDYPERCDFCRVPMLLESGDKDCVWEQHSAVTDKYYRNTDSIIKWHDGRFVHMQHSVDITNLISLQKDLENASKAKGDFLSRMSHEIRTPLNAIIGMINIAMGSVADAKTKDCLNKAEGASKHLLGVINDILDMSKIEADKFELDYREFNFEKMLMNVTNVTNFRTEEKNQNFVVNLNENVPKYIIGDDLRLSQVITNLLTNAVKFTPDNGTIVLNVETIENIENIDNEIELLSDEIVLKISVKDTGIGISEEQQSRLFTSFEQADGSTARKFGGTGLGLAISKRIVELMGGKIWIESELGKGAKFVFTMKAGKGKEKELTKLSNKIIKEDMRILTVDDSPEILEYFTHIMTTLDLPCDVAADGFEALKMVANSGAKPYNIFFIDWQMPEMDGIELTKKIKEIAPDNSVIFMISAANRSIIEKEALAVGVRSFIAKPLFPSTLVNSINECIEITTQKHTNSVIDSTVTKQRNFSNHTILIAEDVEINREIMSAVLEETGVSIEYAENGAIAVSMFLRENQNQGKYSLILMDIHMPEMDGYEATRKIRELEMDMEMERRQNIPIIAMTANVFKEDIEHCLEAGMNDHIGKPIDQDDLFTKLEQYLQ